MRKLCVLAVLCILAISCGKTDSGCQPNPVDAEKNDLIAYATTNNIKYTVHPNGFLYQIVDSGTGAAPISTSVITVNYVAKHFNNIIFDTSFTPFTSSLSNLIDGWKLGLPLIKTGGKLRLIIPSALAYSCVGNKVNGYVVVQPNEPLFFEITLLNVK